MSIAVKELEKKRLRWKANTKNPADWYKIKHPALSKALWVTLCVQYVHYT